MEGTKMNLTQTRKAPFQALMQIRLSPGVIILGINLTALVAFEMFNYSTTEYALGDLLGGLAFAGFRWATILTLAFCMIDFAGIARIFTPAQEIEEPKESWYLFGAWLLAATMNAFLTWWGVSMAIVNHSIQSTSILSSTTLTRVVPVFVAVMVWIIRILIIGSLSMAAGRYLWKTGSRQHSAVTSNRMAPVRNPSTPLTQRVITPNNAPFSIHPGNPTSRTSSSPVKPMEPTYHSLGSSSPAINHPNP
jgi:hypothetical protein